MRALTRPNEPPLRFEVVRRLRDGVPEDLLGYLLRHRRWPAARTRWCTSDLKRGPVKRLITQLANEVYAAEPGRTRPVRILNCLGMRAAESHARAKRPPLRVDANGRREVTEWLPLHTWPTERVWARINAAGAEPHPAYAAGQSRASCVFCVLNGNRGELASAARLHPQLAQLYELAEWLIGHDFRADLAMRDVLAAAEVPLLPRDWPLEAIFQAAPAGTGTAVAIAVLRGELPVAQALAGATRS